MTGQAHRATGLCLILVLIASLTAEPAHAEDRGRFCGEPVWRFGTPGFAPIGELAWSSGAVVVNGRLASGSRAVWSGDAIEALADTSARVSLDSIGHITLKSGRVRLAATLTTIEDSIARPLLIASLNSGDMVVKLEQKAVAYIEAGGSVFVASGGAAFRIEIQNDQALLNVMNGTVNEEPSNIQLEYIVEPVNIEPRTGRPIGSGPNIINVPRSGIKLISVEVKGTKKPVGRGRRVQFALGKPGVGQIGSQSIVVLTNDFGVATATFTAGPNEDSTSVTATDEESGATWKGTIFVTKPIVNWRNRLLLGGAAVAAAIIIIDKWPRGKDPIHQVPPPMTP